MDPCLVQLQITRRCLLQKGLVCLIWVCPAPLVRPRCSPRPSVSRYCVLHTAHSPLANLPPAAAPGLLPTAITRKWVQRYLKFEIYYKTHSFKNRLFKNKVFLLFRHFILPLSFTYFWATTIFLDLSNKSYFCVRCRCVFDFCSCCLSDWCWLRVPRPLSHCLPSHPIVPRVQGVQPEPSFPQHRGIRGPLTPVTEYTQHLPAPPHTHQPRLAFSQHLQAEVSTL